MENWHWLNMIQTAHSSFIEFRLKEKEYFDLKSVLRPVSPPVVEGAKRAMDRAEEAWVDARLSEWRIACRMMGGCEGMRDQALLLRDSFQRHSGQTPE